MNCKRSSRCVAQRDDEFNRKQQIVSQIANEARRERGREKSERWTGGRTDRPFNHRLQPRICVCVCLFTTTVDCLSDKHIVVGKE